MGVGCGTMDAASGPNVDGGSLGLTSTASPFHDSLY